MLNHIALQYPNKEKAVTFFNKILGLEIEREFIIPSELAGSIFRINKEVKAIVFSNEKIRFEIFISNEEKKIIYEHICLNVPNINDFVIQCENNRLHPFYVKKGDREILFVRDFAKYLYEIKESIQ